MPTPPLNALRAFEAVARLGSFRRAAEALSVTQSAVSHQIRNVEESLGRPLFQRQGNRNLLLPQGAELARRLSVAFSEIDSACDDLRTTGQAMVVAAIPSVAMCWLIPRLSRFRAAHPEIEMRVVYALHGRDVPGQDVHLAFVYGAAPQPRPGFRADFFLAGQSVPVCSPSRLDRLGHPPRTVADFLALGLLHDTGERGWKTWLAGLGLGAGALDGPTFEDFNLLRAAVLSGQGVALCPPTMVRPDLASGALVQLSDRQLDEGFDYYLRSATAGPADLLRRVALLRDWALTEREGQA